MCARFTQAYTWAEVQEWIVTPRVNRSGLGDDDPTMIEPQGKTQR